MQNSMQEWRVQPGDADTLMEIIRSWLIAPANRPDFVGKFPGIGADCSVLDLEDGI